MRLGLGRGLGGDGRLSQAPARGGAAFGQRFLNRGDVDGADDPVALAPHDLQFLLVVRALQMNR